MQYKNEVILFLFLIPLLIGSIGAVIGIQQISAQIQQRTTTIDNLNRREYTYCPLSDSDVKAMSAEIDGCPLVRVYINDWNKLTLTQQNTIDTLLRNKGLVDTGEHIIK